MTEHQNDDADTAAAERAKSLDSQKRAPVTPARDPRGFEKR